MMIRRFDIVECSVCKETKKGGEVKFDENDPFNAEKMIAICDDCMIAMDGSDEEE